VNVLVVLILNEFSFISIYATIATTPTPPCAAVSVGSSSSLYTTSGSNTVYTCKTYSWTSPVTGTVTLAFQLRNDPDYNYVDDVSVYNKGVQMLVNGGFESGSLSPGWVLSTPYGTCGATGGSVSNTSPRTGSYSLKDGSVGCADQVSQSFPVIGGQVYVVSFWIMLGGSGSGISASVILS
jgi:glycine/D-amino acid oxidase-like deaminating enzyme